MTASISKMSIDYYFSTISNSDGQIKGVRDLTAYYTDSGDPAGKWFGAGLAGLSLNAGDRVEKFQAKRLFQDSKDPLTGELLGRSQIKATTAPEGAQSPSGQTVKKTREAVAGFDITFSVPKSVSVLWAISTPEVQAKLLAAHRQAMAESLAWLEENVIQTRTGHGGVAKVEVTGLIGSSFDHWDSRAGDPQLHTHAVIANRVQRVSDGQWATLDSYTLHKYVVATSEKYNNLLFDAVYRETGAVAEQRGQEPTIVPSPEGNLAVSDAVEESGKIRVELAGVPNELIEEFSTRSRAIENEKNRLLKEWEDSNGRPAPTEVIIRLRQQATLSTRTAKVSDAQPLAVKMTNWRERTRALGLNPKQVVAAAIGHETTVFESGAITYSAVLEIAGHVLAQTAHKRATFNQANLIATTEKLLTTIRCASASERNEITHQIVEAATGMAASLTPRASRYMDDADAVLTNRGHSIFDSPETAIFASKQLMNDEAFLMGLAANEAGPSLPDPSKVQEALGNVLVGDNHHLSSDQARAALEVLTSKQTLTAIIGPAGTGKTTTMRGIKELWEAHHSPGSIVGLAPSAVAAAVLGEEVGIATDNTAKWLYESVGDGAARRTQRYFQATAAITATENSIKAARSQSATSTPAQRTAQAEKIRQLTRKRQAHAATVAKCVAEQSKYTLRQGQLLIVDEASMAGTTTLAELGAQADRAGAKVLLVGDPAQLESVEAGGILGWMERDHNASHLNQVFRFKADWEKKASLQLREGIIDVLDDYEEEQRLHYSEQGTAAGAAYKAWLTDTTGEPGKSSILIAADNESVGELNLQAQADLTALGRINLDVTVDVRNATAGVGDVLLARQNDRKLKDANGAFIKNGSRLVITEINLDGTIAATREETGATIQLGPDYLAANTELGYAVTAHRAQGVTVDTGHCLVKDGLSRELFYVSMTRGREGNHAYIDVTPDDELHSPDEWNLFHQMVPTQGREILEGVLNNRNAALTAHETLAIEEGKANDLATMVSEYEYATTAIATESFTTWLTANGGQDILHQIQRAPEWARLISAWSQADHNGLTSETAELPPPELLTHLRSLPANGSADAELIDSLLPKSTAANSSDQQILNDLDRRITTRIDYLTKTALSESKKYETIPLGYRYEVARLDAIWTEVSEQSPSDTILGRTPPKSDWRLSRYYKHLKEQLPDLTAPIPEMIDQPWNTEEDLKERLADQGYLDLLDQTLHPNIVAGSARETDADQFDPTLQLPGQDNAAGLDI
ncbi:conjugative relaxase domain-containing protein, TrwC/TraI family [Arthrobacter alpinus]|uniref:Conjugative relaxase domain-containing protein, TrwC/TraI family n=2 Tax=Arthrobacter alpinus TaxID=656366 RepID=A0A1H5PDN3_9MICC|nr:conjugative relaxase domain-containing protein, TrwC/TraI family [Arthrobacter alpinus]